MVVQKKWEVMDWRNAVMYLNNDYYKALIFVFKTIFSWIEGNRQQKINLKACKTYADTGR